MQNFHGSVEAFNVKTVDTTGAGDSFIGALLCKIVDDRSIIEVRLLMNVFFLFKKIHNIFLLFVHCSFAKYIWFGI